MWARSVQIVEAVVCAPFVYSSFQAPSSYGGVGFLSGRIRKNGYCYISSYSTIYEYILSIVNIASKGNPPSIVATYSRL